MLCDPWNHPDRMNSLNRFVWGDSDCAVSKLVEADVVRPLGAPRVARRVMGYNILI